MNIDDDEPRFKFTCGSYVTTGVPAAVIIFGLLLAIFLSGVLVASL